MWYFLVQNVLFWKVLSDSILDTPNILDLDHFPAPFIVFM